VVKAIRTKTQIGRGATSVGSVAVQLAEKILGGDFHDKTVMIIGAGKMGEACVRHIAKKGIRSIIVANRSLEHAEELAREFGGRAVNYMDDGLAAMQARRTSWSVRPAARKPSWTARTWRRSCGSGPIARYFSLTSPCRGTSRWKCNELENVFLYNIDHLEQLMRENVRVREQEVAPLP
jgi:glutamyl-tRNA reductase